MQVVLDTSSLVSAIRSGTGAAAEIIQMVVFRKLTLLLDYKLSCEYREVAHRAEHLAVSGLPSEEVDRLIELIESVAVPVFVAVKYRPLSRDPNDDMILDLAINGEADAIVTNNVKHFETAAQSFGTRVLTPRDFLIAFREGGFPHAR